MCRASVNGVDAGKQKLQRGFQKLQTFMVFSSTHKKSLNEQKSELQVARTNMSRTHKSSMRGPDHSRRRGKRSVRFKGMVSPNYATIVAKCVQYTRAGSLGAAWWEAFMAGVATLDFFMVPLAMVSNAFKAVKKYKGLYDPDGHSVNFTFLLSGVDTIFFINIVFNVCQVCFLFWGCVLSSSGTCSKAADQNVIG